MDAFTGVWDAGTMLGRKVELRSGSRIYLHWKRIERSYSDGVTYHVVAASG